VFEKSAKHRYRSVCVLGTRAISHAQSLEPDRVINRDRYRDGRLALALVQGSGTSTRILTAPHLSQSQSTIFRAGVIAFDLRLRLGDGGASPPPGRARADGEKMTVPNTAPLWKPEEDGLLRSMAAAGETAAAIARRLKRSSEAVRKRAHKLEIRLAASQKGVGRRA
jgi:hypothetical protein